jgi:FkbM family methyltransferase
MRKLLIKFFAIFGYALVRTPSSLRKKKEAIVRIGNYDLLIPSNNPLIYTYSEKKDFASELGRLVNAVYSKYSDLRVLDIGANIGDSAAVISSESDIPIVSVEGEPFTFSYLKRNASQLKNVRLFNYYLGESQKSIPAVLEKEGWNTTIIPSKDSKKTIEFTTIDHLVYNEIREAKKFKLLKIDTEGFDTIILRGAKRFIEEVQPVIYIEYNRQNMEAIQEDGLSTVLALKEKGYQSILFYDDRGRFILATTLDNKELVSELHRYADGKNGLISYYNLCIISREDNDLVKTIVEKEASLL